MSSRSYRLRTPHRDRRIGQWAPVWASVARRIGISGWRRSGRAPGRGVRVGRGARAAVGRGVRGRRWSRQSASRGVGAAAGSLPSRARLVGVPALLLPLRPRTRFSINSSTSGRQPKLVVVEVGENQDSHDYPYRYKPFHSALRASSPSMTLWGSRGTSWKRTPVAS